jgi:ribosomal protein S18 acetylase RimI-like enzyme
LSSYPGAEIVSEPGFEMILTGISHPLGNAVIRTELGERELERWAEVVRKRATDVPIAWFLTHARELELAPVLERAGFASQGGAPAMVLTRLDYAAQLPSARLEEVRDERSLDVWLQVLSAVFDPSRILEPLFGAPFRRLGFGEDSPIRGFVAYMDEKPVATSLVYFAGEVAGVYCVGTLPEARGKGVGTAATGACVEAAFARGAKSVILQSSTLGLPVYEKLGFRTVGRHERWGIPKSQP